MKLKAKFESGHVQVHPILVSSAEKQSTVSPGSTCTVDPTVRAGCFRLTEVSTISLVCLSSFTVSKPSVILTCNSFDSFLCDPFLTSSKAPAGRLGTTCWDQKMDPGRGRSVLSLKQGPYLHTNPPFPAQLEQFRGIPDGSQGYTAQQRRLEFI